MSCKSCTSCSQGSLPCHSFSPGGHLSVASPDMGIHSPREDSPATLKGRRYWVWTSSRQADICAGAKLSLYFLQSRYKGCS